MSSASCASFAPACPARASARRERALGFRRRQRRRSAFVAAVVAATVARTRHVGLRVGLAAGLRRAEVGQEGALAPHARHEGTDTRAAQPTRAPRLLLAKTRLLASLVTSRGRFAVWVVPRADGERCTFLQQVGTRTLGTFPCSTRPQTLSPGSYSGEGIALIGGFAPPRTESVEIRGAPGWGRKTVPVRRGFYFGRVPGPIALAVIGRDAQGHVVARRSLLRPEPPPARSIVPTDRTALELRTRRGEKVALIVGPGPGGTCVTWDAADPLGGQASCGAFPEHGLRGGIMQLGAAPHSTVFLEGETGPEVSAVRIRFEDGRTMPVKFGLRVFLYEVLPETTSKDTARRRSSA